MNSDSGIAGIEKEWKNMLELARPDGMGKDICDHMYWYRDDTIDEFLLWSWSDTGIFEIEKTHSYQLAFANTFLDFIGSVNTVASDNSVHLVICASTTEFGGMLFRCQQEIFCSKHSDKANRVRFKNLKLPPDSVIFRASNIACAKIMKTRENINFNTEADNVIRIIENFQEAKKETDDNVQKQDYAEIYAQWQRVVQESNDRDLTWEEFCRQEVKKLSHSVNYYYAMLDSQSIIEKLAENTEYNPTTYNRISRDIPSIVKFAEVKHLQNLINSIA